MITLPTQLANFMKGKDLAGLKPFALLYRNKWDSVNNKFVLEDTPIDISALIAKPNTLSMTLDVNEVAQYNANNVTLTLEDTKNYFVEGTPNSYFPEGYQVYGSKVVLYYGLNTPINPYPTQVGYTVLGSPTITDGVASNFSNNNYVAVPAFSPANNTWQIATKIKLTDTTTNQVIFSNNYQPNRQIQLSVQNSKLKVYISTNGTSANLANGVFGTATILADTVYWVKFEFTRNAYIVSYSLNGISWTPDIIINSTATLVSVSNNLFFGRNTHPSFPEPLTDGSIIYLNETYIKVNGEYWFNGAHFFWQNNSTPLFTGVIKELPAHKPDKYQVDLKLVSPLEMLKDIEAKNFSDKVTGEVLTLDHTGDNNEEFYLTAQKGVGGITALYANGVKLYEGVDYEVSQLNELNYQAEIEVKNSTVFGQVFTVDYYYWKRGLAIEEIVAGLAGLGGYSGATEDIQPVVWTTAVRSPSTVSNVLGAIGYYESALNEYTFNWHNRYGNSWQNTQGTGGITQILPDNFDYSVSVQIGTTNDVYAISLGDTYSGTTITYNNYNIGPCGVANGISIRFSRSVLGQWFIVIYSITNSAATLIYNVDGTNSHTFSSAFEVKRRSNSVEIYYNGTLVATTTVTGSMNYHYQYSAPGQNSYIRFLSQTWNLYDDNLVLHGANLTQPCIVTDTLDMTAGGQAWGAIEAELGQDAIYFLNAYFSTDAGATWSGAYSYNLDVNMSRPERYLYYVLGVPDNQASFDIKDPSTYFYASTLVLNIVNLSGSTVLEALQDLALISGYEFGVDRQGVFFFRPRLSSTTPVYVLDHSELVKVDSVKKNLSDFFTKLTLTFAQVPLEFYANTGARPTPIDKYGVINKEIDKPDIVNYDNPELAQAIGPQLLEVYSALPNVIQATGKLNLALELADIVSLRRNYNLIADPEGTEFEKYINQQTYYRACKITGLNYNFSKKQITYTLRDVTDSYPNPQPGDLYEFVYDLPIRLGVK